MKKFVYSSATIFERNLSSYSPKSFSRYEYYPELVLDAVLADDTEVRAPCSLIFYCICLLANICSSISKKEETLS